MFGITTQLLPVLLVDSADYHPSKGIISLGRCPWEIIHSRSDILHFPPTSQAITVFYEPVHKATSFFSNKSIKWRIINVDWSEFQGNMKK